MDLPKSRVIVGLLVVNERESKSFSKKDDFLPGPQDTEFMLLNSSIDYCSL